MSLLCVLLLLAFGNPIPYLTDLYHVVRTRAELPHAMERWEAQGIARYRVSVKGFVPLVCIIEGELTIQDGQLVQVRMRENALVPEAPLHPVHPDRWEIPGCSFQDLTVPAMFENAELRLEEIGVFDAPLTIQFDEALGYITEFRVGRSSRGGILEPSVSECCTWFEFSNLTAIP